MFSEVSCLENFRQSRYEALEEAVSLLRSKGVSVESVLHIVCKADHCHLTFEIGDATVAFNIAGIFGDCDSDEKVIELSLIFYGGFERPDKEWSYKYKAGELELLCRMLEDRRCKREKEKS